MNLNLFFRIFNTALTLLGTASISHAQKSQSEDDLIITLGVLSKNNISDDAHLVKQLQKTFTNTAADLKYKITLEPEGIIAKVKVKEDIECITLDSLIKRLNAQLEEEIVIIKVEPTKITNGTQDDL